MSKDVRLVLLSGGGGGVVSWAYTMIGGAAFGLNEFLALPLSIILGAAAALVAVYIVIPADTTKTAKLTAFAVLCGFLWKPVLDAGRLVITQNLKASETKAEVKTNVAELKAASPAAAPIKAQEAADSAAELVRIGDTLGNPAISENATKQATEAAQAIAQTPTLDPLAAKAALQQINHAAIETRNVQLQNVTQRHIDAIESRVGDRRQ
ncbi:MAG TPA: hypothetical protein VF432_11580 [Thermoanaerobaculia bacterium]